MYTVSVFSLVNPWANLPCVTFPCNLAGNAPESKPHMMIIGSGDTKIPYQSTLYGKPPFLMAKSTISMAIFNSKLLVYQRVLLIVGGYIYIYEYHHILIIIILLLYNTIITYY